MGLVSKTAQVLFWPLWIAAAFFISQFLIVGLSMSPLIANLLGDGTLSMMLIQALVYAVTLVLAVGVPYLLKDRAKLPKIPKLLSVDRRLKAKDFLAGAKYLVIYYAFLLAIMIPLTLLLPDIMGQEQDIGFDTATTVPWELVLVFIALVVIAPLAEELLMRGLLFGRLREQLPFWPTALIVSAVFALAHWQFNVSIDTFILSMVLCFAREKTGTVYAGVLIHAVKNCVAFGLLFFS